MKFEIRKSEKGSPITLGDLDKEAANFFGVEVTKKWAASTRGLDQYNWIGYAIAALPENEEKPVEWFEVIARMSRTMCTGVSSGDEFVEDMTSLKPLVELVLHWKNKDTKHILFK